MTKQKSESDMEKIRHSLAHLLAMAVLKKFPQAKLGIGPTIESGFYYDFDFSNVPRMKSNASRITEVDLRLLEEDMRQFIRQNLIFRGKRVTPAVARRIFRGQPFKLDLIHEFVRQKKSLTVYSTFENYSGKFEKDSRELFVDLCRGGHAKNTSEINPEAFKLTKISGAYWRGDEKNPMLTRIYGLAFDTKRELDEHLRLLAEAERRDHKRLGPALDLFTFSEIVGPGLPLWTPKGTVLRDLLDDLVWELRKKRGYERVDIPHLAKKELYEKSGHWDKFKNELFKITTREGHLFAVKPMNCPHHIQLYARRQWSYRELPQRYVSTTKQYRDEQTGELAGLARVRSITIDDAHVFCRHSQMKTEILGIWNIIDEFYGRFGFPLRVRLSLHDPKNPKQYLGRPALWKNAEETLRAIAGEKRARAEESIGEAAFYGPKVDFMARDSLGREWQVATIQLDMNQPERFDLFCINERGEKERIVMIHAAIMGSIERFLSILIEHYAGAFPLWLAPVQIAILPISDKVKPYCLEVLRTLRQHNFRVTLDERNETIGRKIREAELQKIPYLVIIGEREMAAKNVSVRQRQKGDLGAMKLEQFLRMAGKK